MTEAEQLKRWQDQTKILAVVQAAYSGPAGRRRTEVVHYDHAGDIYLDDLGRVELCPVFAPMIPLSHKVN